jgi:hypothetical protein
MIEDFMPSQHYDLMNSWYKARKMKTIRIEFFPKIGFVSNRIAAGFLVKTDTETCIFDYLVSDPREAPMDRGRAVIEVVAALLAAGRVLGFRRVSILTGLSGVKDLAARFGLKVIPKMVCMEGNL